MKEENVNLILKELKKELDVEQFEDYEEKLYEGRINHIVEIKEFVEENIRQNKEMEDLENEIENKYENASKYLAYLERYEDSISNNEYGCYEKLYKLGLMDAIKVIGEKEEANAILNIHNKEEIETILNQRIDEILHNIVNHKNNNLDWEKEIEDNIKSEELVLKYKALIDKNIMLNRQLVYKYGLYDVMYIFKLSKDE